VDLRKINIIMNMSTPTSVTKLKRFFKATWFYLCYLRNFIAKVAPMCKLLKDIQHWWDEACEQSF